VKEKAEKIRDTVNNTIELLKSGLLETDAVYEASASNEAGSTMSRVRIREHCFVSDVNPLLGGNDVAPCPAEYLLGALACCIRASFVIHASRMEIDLKFVDVMVSGTGDRRATLGLCDEIPAGFRKLDYKVRLVSGESKEKINKLVKFVKCHCHVINTLKRSINVEGEFEIKRH